MAEKIPSNEPDPNDYNPNELVKYMNAIIGYYGQHVKLDSIAKKWRAVHPAEAPIKDEEVIPPQPNPIKIIVEPTDDITRGMGRTGRRNPITGTNESDQG